MSEELNEAADLETEQEEVDTTEEEVRAAFDEGVSVDLEEDDLKLNMIGAGATFKNVTRLYNKFMIDAGLAISKDDRNQIVADTLEGRDFDTEEDFDAASAALVEAVKGATARSASSLVRSYAKKNDLDCYAKPKGEGTSRVTFRSTYYDWIVGNPDATLDQAKAYIMGEGEYGPTSENIQKHASAHLNVFSMTRRLVAKLRGEDAPAIAA